MSGGKGGSETTKTEIPAWIRDPAIRNLARAEAVQRIPYMPYYGPDVAAFTPTQNAAFDQNIGAAEAFGLLAPNTLTATSGMPTPTEYAGGFTGYSSQPMYEQALAELKANQPGAVAQYDALYGSNVPTTWGNNPRFRGSAGGGGVTPRGKKDYGDVPIPGLTGPSLGDIVLKDPKTGLPMSNPIAATTISWNEPTRDARGNLPSVPLSTPSFNLKPPPHKWDLSPGHPSLNVVKKKVDTMIPNNTVRKEVVPHYRPTEKNVGGSSLFESHPLSEGATQILARDLKNRRK